MKPSLNHPIGVASRRRRISVTIARQRRNAIATRVVGVLVVLVCVFSAEVMGFDVRQVPKYTISNNKEGKKKGPGTAVWGTYTAALQYNGTQANPPMLVSSTAFHSSNKKETTSRKPVGFKAPPLMTVMGTKNNNRVLVEEDHVYWNAFSGNTDTTMDDMGDDYLDLLHTDDDDDKDLPLPLPYLILKMARRFPSLPYFMRKDFSEATTTTTTLTSRNKMKGRQEQQHDPEQHQEFFESTHQQACQCLQLDANVRAIFEGHPMDVLKTNRLSSKAPSRPIRVDGVEMVAYELGFPVRSKYASGVAMAMATPTKGMVQLTLYWQYHSHHTTGSNAKGGIAMPASQMQRLHVDLSPKRRRG